MGNHDEGYHNIEEVDTVPGRCELIDEEQTIRVIVDYAQTPNSLSRLLDSMRELGAKRINSVFGSPGEQDRGKRLVMTKIATDKIDVVLLTCDNQRTEDPLDILDDMFAGVGWTMQGYLKYGENDYYPPLPYGHSSEEYKDHLVAEIILDMKLWPFKVVPKPDDKPMLVVNCKGEMNVLIIELDSGTFDGPLLTVEEGICEMTATAGVLTQVYECQLKDIDGKKLMFTAKKGLELEKTEDVGHYTNQFSWFTSPRPPESLTLTTRFILRGEECCEHKKGYALRLVI